MSVSFVRVCLLLLGIASFAYPLQAASPIVSIQRNPDRSLRLEWSVEPAGFVLEQTASLAAPIQWSGVLEPLSQSGGLVSVAIQPAGQTRFFRLRQAVVRPLVIASSSPAQGETGVAVTRETIFRLSAPLAPDTTLDENRLVAHAAGRRILSRVELSGDRRTATLFYLENVPADSRVEVTFDGTALFDANNLPVDLDGDGVVGGLARLSFETLSTMALSTTGIEGRVFASEKNADGSNRPLKNVTITVDGMEETLRTTTDAGGFFRLAPSPAGRFFVSVDGRTAEGSQWPSGAYYPFVGKAWDAAPGRTNNLAGGSGIIYLPLIQAEALKTVSAVSDTRITFAPSVLATNPALVGVEITVPANALFSDNGTRGGKVGMAPVAPDRLPEPLPPGLNLPIVITIQTDGPRNFDQPIPVKFPNLPDPITGVKLLPGEKTALWSFNHDTGRWEIQGSMTINADGLFAVSDPGVGVLQPGWHGPGPGGPGCGTDCDGDPPCPTCKDKPKPKPDCSVFNFACEENPCKSQAKFVAISAKDLADDLFAASTKGSGSGLADCALGTVLAGSRAARDCSLGLEQCASIGIFNPIIDAAIGSVLGCIPDVGSYVAAAWTLKSVVINLKNLQLCNNPPASLMARQSLNPASLAKSSGGSEALSRIVALLEQQIAVSTAASNLMAQTLGSGLWAVSESPEDVPVHQQFFSAVQVAVAKESPGGQRITAEEHAALLNVPRPNNATAADLDQLLARLTLMADGGFHAGEPGADAFIAAFAQLETLVNAREADGWTTLQDGLMLALSELSGLMEPAPGSSDYPALTPPPPALAKQAAAAPTATEMAFPKKAHFYALLDMRTGFVRRGRLENDGRFAPLILPPKTPFLLSYFNPDSGHTGAACFFSTSTGRTTRIPAALMGPDRGTDSDGDELSDVQELIRGTNPERRDSDGDGVPDGAEIASGMNPLDGEPLGLGVVAVRDTLGTAAKIDTVNDFAVVADSNSGLAVFNVANPLAPLLATQFPLAGGAFNAVATAGDFVAAVPGVPAGVHLFRRSQDGTLTPSGNVAVGAVPGAVVAAGRYAYAPGRSANAPTLAVVRLRDALLIRHVPVSGGDTFSTLTVEGDVLWAVSASRLHGYRLEGDSLQELGKLDLGALANVSGEAALELAVGGGRAYVGDARGFRIVDVSNPVLPVLLHASPNTVQPMRALALSGSGFLLAGQTLNVELYDVRSDRATNFLASFVAPGTPRDVSLHRGYALLADGAAGLAVVNFATPDRGTNAPTITLRAFPSHPPDGQESEEQFFVSTTTTDDVQVRDVEFFIDGVAVARGGKFPFAATLRAPTLLATRTSFVVRAKATDTGGNSAWSQETTLKLLPDLTPPRLLSFTPANNSTLARGSLSTLSATFDSVMALAGFRSGWTLVAAGVDGDLGTADDMVVDGGEPVYDAPQQTVILRFKAPLRSGKYRSRLATSVADLAGNPLGANVTWDFTIPAPKPVEVSPVSQSVLLTDTLRRVEVRFDERLSAASVTAASLRVLSTNLINPIVLSGGVTSLSADGRGAVLEFPQPVANGAWRIMFTPEIRDVYGSPVQTNLLATFIVKGLTHWATNTSGAWELGRNWSSGLAPILKDHVVIDRPDSVLTVTLNSSPTLTTLRSTEIIALNGRTLAVADKAELLGGLRWGGSSRLAGGVIDLGGETLVAGGSFGNQAILERGILRNAGRVEVSSGIWLLNTPNAVIENLAGGVIHLAPTTAAEIERDRVQGTIASDGTRSRVVNHGLIEGLSDGRRWRLQNLALENHGVFRVPKSALEMESGFFQNAPGGVLESSSLVLTHVSGSLEGDVSLQGGLGYTNNSSEAVLKLGGGNLDFGTSGITVYGGTLHVASPLTVRRLNLLYGTVSQLRLDAALTVTDSAGLKIGRADGAGQLRLLGTTRPARGFGSDNWKLYDTVRVENFGSLQISNSSVTCYDTSLFINQPGGLVEIFDNSEIRGDFFANPSRLEAGTNYGVLRKLGVRESFIHMANDGRVEATHGTAHFTYGRHHGRFDVATGAAVMIENGVLETNSVVAGEGQLVLKRSSVRGQLDVKRVVLDSPTPLFEGNVAVRELEMKNYGDGSQFLARGRVDVSERWIAATNDVATRLTEGTLRLHGPQVVGVVGIGDNAVLENAGQLTVLGNLVGPFVNRSTQGRFVNLPGATATLAGSGDGLVLFENQGTLVKEGKGTVVFLNRSSTNSGVIQVRDGRLDFSGGLGQTPAGEIQLLGGNVALREHNFGILSGSGTNFSPVFINNATLRPGSPLGIFRIRGNSGRFEQTTNGVLEIEVGGAQPGVGHDQVFSEDALNLAGTLRLSLRDNFTPALGQEFTILAGRQISSGAPRFNTVEGAAIGGGMRFDVLYETNAVKLRVVALQ